MKKNMSICFSYAGKSDNFFDRFAPCHPISNGKSDRETFTDELYNELNRRFTVYKMEDNHTGDIDRFRRKIADSKYIVVVLSHKYVMSAQCMIEWHEIHSHNDLTSKSIWYVVYDEELMKTDDGTEYKIPSFDFIEADKTYYNNLIVPTWQKWMSQYPKSAAGALVKKVYETNCFFDDYVKMRDIMSSLDRVRHKTSDCNIDRLILSIIDEILENENKSLNIDSKYDYNTLVFAPLFYNSSNGNELFGRLKLAEELYATFFYKKLTCINVYAIGGQGKTMFAHIYKNKYREKYGRIHHFSIYHGLDSGFVEGFRKVFPKEFWDGVKGYEDREKRIFLIAELNKIPSIEGKPNLLVLDINIHKRENVEQLFSPEYMNDFSVLKDRWHILLLSRYPFQSSFDKANGVRSERICQLPSFEHEPQEARRMFRIISEINEEKCSDENLDKVLFQIHYHPLLISVLASYCKRHKDRIKDAKSIADSLDLSLGEMLPNQDLQHGEGSDFDVYSYLEKLIDFDEFESPECKILLRHLILFPYKYIPMEVIDALIPNKMHKKSFEYYLNILVSDMVLTTNEEEYRVSGWTIEQACTMLADDGDEDFRGYTPKKEEEFIKKLEDMEIVLTKFTGYQLHDMLAKTLIKKTEEESITYDYSIFFERIRDMFISPENMVVFRNCFNYVYSLMYKGGGDSFSKPKDFLKKIIADHTDLYIFAASHFFYYSDNDVKENVKEKAVESLAVFKFDKNDDLSYLENVAVALHDLFIVLYLTQDIPNAYKSLERAIEIRKTICQRQPQVDNYRKLATEHYTMCCFSNKIRNRKSLLFHRKEGVAILRKITQPTYEDIILQYLILRKQGFIGRLFSIWKIWSLKKQINTFPDKFKPSPVMIEVEGGLFEMGSEDNDAYRDEKPVHPVRVDSFRLAKYPITQFQWDYIMGDEYPSCLCVDSHRGFGPDFPMYDVSWEQAQKFIKKLGRKNGIVYSLPTEAEWEYAARWGSFKKYNKFCGSDGINDVAWYIGNSKASAHSVGELQPNELGLYDMSGNVWEWCEDLYDVDFYQNCLDKYKNDNYVMANPVNIERGSTHVLRGGSWVGSARYCRVSYRYHYYPPDFGDGGTGFRLAIRLHNNETDKNH
ncbi:MAG: SUMF1/EgtB/PvdO family nonheme iron enzyme [Bacteroidales bacterium]|nr:SUMF1/EgtB/PvdO family nonheme iron enzyme [Bacteroidales bacterium]